jgi:serine/threonine protein kinase
MLHSATENTELNVLDGVVVASERNPGVSYRLERCIGEGGMSVAFFALRQAPEGLAPVVVKVVRPSIVAGAGSTAAMLVQKEAVALGRLNERVPPTPFVVRLIDTGNSQFFAGRPALPWLAVEYVHGGIEGTTLEDRVAYSCAETGSAFSAARAAHAVRCIATGLSAIHAVGVIHRDLTPCNVLCCGFGEAEILKISDFGIARPQGMASTFGQVLLGTPGYCAPEQVFQEATTVGTHTDVFSFACLLFFLLTGEPYFPGRTAVESALAMRKSDRRKLIDSAFLVPELRERGAACHAIDHALARGTALDAMYRPAQAQEFAASVLPWLMPKEAPPRPSRRLLDSLLNMASPTDLTGWTWTTLHPPGDDRIIQNAAWDVDGHCLITTTRGPAFWNGQSWVDRLPEAMRLPSRVQFARRAEAGTWLIGGNDGTLAVYTTDGIGEIVRCPDQAAVFMHASGRFDDLLTAVAHAPGSEPTLWAMAARRWLKPLPLHGVAYVSALLRLDDNRWVVCGRLAQGGGFAAIYTPTHWETAPLPVPPTRAVVAGCSQVERELALVVGSGGLSLRIEGDSATSSRVDGEPDLTACAMDVLDREWVASMGHLWVRDPERRQQWSLVWQNASWPAPFISIMADAGVVTAMTVDGGVLEGRAGWRAPPPRRSPHPDAQR